MFDKKPKNKYKIDEFTPYIMKAKNIILIFGFILLLIIAIFLYTNKSTDKKISSFDNSNTPKIEKQIFEYKENQALLHKEEGEVFFSIPEKPETQLTIDEIYIPSGTKVRTTNSIALVVFLDDSIMTIDKNTEVKINFDTKNISIFQTIGNTWHRATSLLSSNNSYQVETSSALATVRGTIFGLSVFKNQGLNLIVKESIVDLSKKIKPNTPVKFISQVKTGEGFFTSQADYSLENLRDLTQEDLNQEWITKNNTLDLQWKTLEYNPQPKLTPHELLEYLRRLDLQPAPKVISIPTTNLKPVSIFEPEIITIPLADPEPTRGTESTTDTQANTTTDPQIDTTPTKTDTTPTTTTDPQINTAPTTSDPAPITDITLLDTTLTPITNFEIIPTKIFEPLIITGFTTSTTNIN